AARLPTGRSAGIYTGTLGFSAAMLPLFVAVLVGLVAETSGRGGWWPLLPGCASPPVALGVSAFSWTDLAEIRSQPTELALIVVGIVAGVVVYGWLTRRLWRG